MLLARAEMPAIEAIEHLAGIQAQEPKSPYVGLWSRLEHFRPEELEQLLTTRQAVRIIVMRGTIHLISARDCVMMRPLTQPIMDRWMKYSREIKTHLAGVDMGKLASAARRLFEQKPRTVADGVEAAGGEVARARPHDDRPRRARDAAAGPMSAARSLARQRSSRVRDRRELARSSAGIRGGG